VTPAGPGVVLRYGELFLKRDNRRLFEDALERNVRRAVGGRDDVAVRREHGRIFLLGASDRDLLDRLRWVFGVSSISPVVFCERDLDPIRRRAVDLAVERASDARSFRISARRSDKGFAHTSADLGRDLGAAVVEATGLAVDLEEPDLTVGVEVGRDWVFLWTERFAGPGGLPVGTAGRVLLLLSGGIDSPAAGHLLQKRGVELDAVYFRSFPYTGDGALDKVREIARILAARQGDLRLFTVPFARIQEALRDGADPPYLVILYRRAMLGIAERIASERGARALATGESLGQVASQTLANLAAVEAASSAPVLRPLVGFDKAETIDLARRIGTYEISIRPHDDCCTLFVPRHPETRGTADRAALLEAGIDLEPLLEEAVAGAEVETIR